MSKSRNHRKRHVPSGPVGVWFRTQQQVSKKESSDKKSNYAHRSSSEDSSRCNSSQSNKSNNSKRGTDNSFSPVWSNVQEDLKLDTPYLSSWSDPKQKYQKLRPHLPRNFILLREVLLGDYDFAIPAGFHLLLLVNAIESHNLHSICTVELHDETGLSVRAWVEPRFVQEQMQKQRDASVIRTGVIWMLKEVGMMVQMNEDDEEVERILLIGVKHIAKVWTPEDAKDIDFLQHMERKKAISQHIAKTDDTIEEFQDSPVEECIRQIGENCDQENRYSYETTGDGITSRTIAQNDLPYPSKKGEGEISRAANSLLPLPLVQTDQSTSQRDCNALVRNTENWPESPIEENLAAAKQRSKSNSVQRSPTEMDDGNGKRRTFTSHKHPIHTDPKHSVAEKRRKCSGILPERSSQQEGGASTTNSLSGGCLWDNVKGDATLQLFDENDDDQTHDGNNFAGCQSMLANAPSLSMEASKRQEEKSTSNSTRVEIVESEKRMIEIRSELCSSLSQDQTVSELSSSIFEASNCAGIDLSAFDDDE